MPSSYIGCLGSILPTLGLGVRLSLVSSRVPSLPMVAIHDRRVDSRLRWARTRSPAYHTRGSVEKGELKPGGARAVPEDACGACWVRVGRRRWMANALVQGY
eukprot:scaffold126_cov142-Skeletonema_marinoi.AAC.10